MDELARVLSVECRLLELLLLKLVEVERAFERVQEAELHRAILVHDLAAETGVPDEAMTLSTLARDSVEPFRTIFSEHRLAFLELAAEIDLPIPSLADFLGS